MLVMVDVGGLAPGSYLVGIDDAGTLGATGGVGAATGFPAAAPTAPATRQSQLQPQAPEGGVGPARRARPNTAAPPATAPQPGGSPGAQPQGRYESRPGQLPATVLAQVLDAAQTDTPATGETAPGAGQVPQETPATGQAPSLETPATGQAAPLDTPATGRRQPLDTPATGELPQGDPTATDPTNAPRDPQDPQGAGNLPIGAGGGPGIGPAVTVGLLTVDASGTGRLQQVVEGIQVEQVVGQAIVIYTEQVPGSTTLPPNLDVGGNAPAGATATGQAQQTNQSAGSSGIATQATAPNQVVPQTAGGVVPNGSQTPVAAGLIQLMSDGGPTAATGDVQQPAASLPTSEQELR
jgi:hypothetical protein